ncbi:MAG: hypothetical protein GY906_11620 [bacterium]|nr:hypothetical protein [bacterium]
MARTELTPQQLAHQSVTVVADAADLTFTAGDAVNGNSVKCTGKEIVIAKNTDSGAQTVTIDAAPDARGRDGTITAYSIGVGEEAAFGPFQTAVWKQTDGMLHIDVSDATVEIAILRLP